MVTTKDGKRAMMTTDNQQETNVLSIDPGRRKLAWALMTNGKLDGAGVIVVPKTEQRDLSELIDYFIIELAKELRGKQRCVKSVVERMRVYPGRSKGDINQLLDIQAIGSAVGSKLAVDLEMVYPQQWKRNQSKEVSHSIIRSRLDREETEVLEDALTESGKTYAGDVLDAVGIGLYGLRRY